jgi:hypothetical protein
MNKRFGFAAAAYFAVWAAVAGAVAYGILQAGYSAWIAVASALLLVAFLSGSLAYIAHGRRLRLEGKEPPSFFQFLFFPPGFPKFKEAAPRFEHFVVGIAAVITGVFFVFCGVALAVDAEWSRISQPVLVASICMVLAGTGALFLYLAWRLFAFSRKPPANVA